MKAHITRHFFGSFYKQPLASVWKGLNNLLRSQLQSSELWQLGHSWSGVSAYTMKLIHLASPVQARGRVALVELLSNQRAILGFGFGMVGTFSLFAYLLFPESPRSNWYYQNWFYFLESIRLWVALCLFSTCFLFSVPSKYKSIWVVYALTFSVGLCGVVHYSFFVDSFETFHCLTVESRNILLAYVLVPSFFVGFGFILAMDYLCYRKYHLKDGNLARVNGIIKTPNVSAEVKLMYLDNLIMERENYNSRI